MAAVHRMTITTTCVIIFLVSIFGKSQGLVHELDKGNIVKMSLGGVMFPTTLVYPVVKFLQGKLLTLTFVDSPTCTRCRFLFPFFVAASQVFPNDPEIFFTRTHDKALVKQWDVTDLPAIIYHRIGVKGHQLMNVDITVDDIIDAIARILSGNFGGLTRTYTVYINDKNYNELITTPKQSVLMLVHDKADSTEREEIDKLAYVFRNDDAILITSLDVTTQKALRDTIMLTRETPVVMWFVSDKTEKPKRFGADLNHELLTQFVNYRTGLGRNTQGDLNPEAGRIKAVDEILDNNIIQIMEGKPDQMEPVIAAVEALQGKVERQHIKSLEYYLYVVENIAAAGADTPVRNTLKELEKRLATKEGQSTKQRDTLKRKQNIVTHFLRLEKNYSSDKKTRSLEEIQSEIDERKREQESKIKKSPLPDSKKHEEL